MGTENNEKHNEKVTGLLIGGCLLLGMGVGFFIDKMVAGLFIGLGVGLLASAAYRVRN